MPAILLTKTRWSMRSNLFKKNFRKNIFSGDGANMASCQDNFGSLALEDDETVLAIRLAEALRADEVETFLEIYDSIPSTTEIRRVAEIKEMARQLAALPKKQFEIYRSKKILSNDHSFLWPAGSTQVIKDKLNTSFISKSVISNVEKDLNLLQNQVEVLGYTDSQEEINGSTDSASNETMSKTGNKKKRARSKKGKVANSVANGTANPSTDSTSNGTEGQSNSSVENGNGKLAMDSVTNATGKLAENNLDMKHKVLNLENCAPLSISMNTDFVTDISTGQVLETGQNCKSSRTDLRSSGSLSSTDSGIASPKELVMGDGIKEVDSGLGSYNSPVFPKEPPFGFPPSSQKLLESALGLLPSVALEKDNSFNVTESSENTKKFHQKSEDSDIQNTDHIEDDPISDVSDTKEVCKDFVVIEGDSVDGDVSSSSAVEDEGGWQSQTRRSHKRKKRELAARASREKNHVDRFQKKDFHKQQSDNQFRKNHHRRKFVDDKRNQVRSSEKKFQNGENKNSNVVESSAANSNVDGQIQTKNHKNNELKATKRLDMSSDDKNSSQKELSPTQKVLSYRDVLLKAKGKAERVESSDSGVDANSVSSCELSSRHPEAQSDFFNHQQCVDYLRNAWKKVMSNAKQGLVIYYSVDSDPVLCEQKRKKLAARNHGVSSKSQ